MSKDTKTVEAEAKQGRCYRRRPADDGGEYLLFPDDLDQDLLTANLTPNVKPSGNRAKLRCREEARTGSLA